MRGSAWDGTHRELLGDLPRKVPEVLMAPFPDLVLATCQWGPMEGWRSAQIRLDQIKFMSTLLSHRAGGI